MEKTNEKNIHSMFAYTISQLSFNLHPHLQSFFVSFFLIFSNFSAFLLSYDKPAFCIILNAYEFTIRVCFYLCFLVLPKVKEVLRDSWCSAVDDEMEHSMFLPDPHAVLSLASSPTNGIYIYFCSFLRI